MKRWFLGLSVGLILALGSVIYLAQQEAWDSDLDAVSLILNWVPEPEFGGFYAAQNLGIYENHGLEMRIQEGRAGTPSVQMLAAGRFDFAITSGSELIIARDRGIDVIAVFSVYHDSPFGIMTHRSRGFGRLEELFEQGGTLAIQKGQAFTSFLQSNFDLSALRVVPHQGGVGPFLHDPLFAQQGFVFSEPLIAEEAGVEVDFFPLSTVGYNPYTLVMAVRGEYLRNNEERVRRVVAASKKGWEAYLENPSPTNEWMNPMNQSMSLQVMEEGARSQAPMIQPTPDFEVGTMRVERWATHIDQLTEAGLVDSEVKPEDCFLNF